MITYEIESLAKIEPEARGMTYGYLQEAASPFESQINWPLYFTMEAAGLIHVIAVRDDEILIGFAVMSVSEHHNAQGVITAHELAIYIVPAYRRGRIGIKLLDLMEQHARNLGAKFILITSRGGNLTPLLHYRRFKELETTFVKGLE